MKYANGDHDSDDGASVSTPGSGEPQRHDAIHEGAAAHRAPRALCAHLPADEAIQVPVPYGCLPPPRKGSDQSQDDPILLESRILRRALR